MESTEHKRIAVGQRIDVETPAGVQQDEVLLVLHGSADYGVWLVETRRNGAVVVMLGADGRWSTD